MKKSVYLGFVAAFILLVGTNGMAAAPQWKIDPPHSNIYFGIHHIYSTVKGHFNEFEGTIRADRTWRMLSMSPGKRVPWSRM